MFGYQFILCDKHGFLICDGLGNNYAIKGIVGPLDFSCFFSYARERELTLLNPKIQAEDREQLFCLDPNFSTVKKVVEFQIDHGRNQ